MIVAGDQHCAGNDRQIRRHRLLRAGSRLAILWLLNVFDRKADTTPTGTCKYIALPNKGEVLPFGDWCFRMVQGPVLHFRSRYRFELDTSGMPEAKVDVYDGDDRRYYRAGDCFVLGVPWSRIEIAAIKGPGVIRVRVGEPVNWKDKLTSC
jgi:hypothetical protein